MKRKNLFRAIDFAGWRSFWDEKLYTSVIAKRFRKMINWLYSHMINGFFGKIFTAYSAEERVFESGVVGRLCGNRNKSGTKATGVRLSMSRIFERSVILVTLGQLFSSLIHRKLKTYGAFFMSIGAYGIVAYLIREFVFAHSGGNSADLVLCVSLFLLSLPMMMSKETFASAAMKSRIMSALLFNGLGLPKDSFVKTEDLPNRYSLVTLLGMILGGLTYFISPVVYLAIAAIILAGSLILTYPEVGILALFALVPLSALLPYSSEILFAVLLVTTGSYIVKLIRGKRGFHLRLMDFAVLLFMLVQLLGGLVSTGGVRSLRASVFYCVLMMGYFLVVNLIRTGEWVKRCTVTTLLCGSASALFGVVQIFTGTSDASWLDVEAFSNIETRITATFDNPNVYAAYLLLVIPFALAFFVRKEEGAPKFRYGLCLLLLVVCMVETWSRGAWLGILISIVLFFLIYTRRSLPFVLAGGVLLPLSSFVLSDNVIERFVSIGSASDSSSLYRIAAWRGVGRMLKENWFAGIGFGEAAFSAVYPTFSYAGIESICHTHNLYLQIISETGIVGIILFALVVILFIQNCFESIYRRRNAAASALVIAGMTAVIAILIMGLTDYVWYNARVFLMFWLVMGITNAGIRIGEEELKRSLAAREHSPQYVNLDLNVDNL